MVVNLIIKIIEAFLPIIGYNIKNSMENLFLIINAFFDEPLHNFYESFSFKFVGVLQKFNVLLQCIFVKKDALAFKCERGHSFILTGKVISHRCLTCTFMPAWNICQADKKYSQYKRKSCGQLVPST